MNFQQYLEQFLVSKISSTILEARLTELLPDTGCAKARVYEIINGEVQDRIYILRLTEVPDSDPTIEWWPFVDLQLMSERLENIENTLNSLINLNK